MTRLIASLFFVLLSGSAFAATCPQTILQVKDNLNNTANMSIADDGTGNGTCMTLGEAQVVAAVKSTLPLGTTGGWTPKLLTSLSNAAVSVKASAGWLGLAQCDNNNTAWSYIQVYNVVSGSVTVGTTTPLQVIPLAPGLPNGFAMTAIGMQYATAISVAATTTPAGAAAPSNPITCSFGFN